MAHRVCPWWIGYLLVSPTRKLMQDPVAIVAPFVSEGMTVLEPGPGMGFFTLELARRVGSTGKVVAVDIQSKMLARLRYRAKKANLLDRIDIRLVQPGDMDIQDLAGRVDFVLAFTMVHELPDQDHFFTEVIEGLKPGGKILIAEPSGHIGHAAFASTLALAKRAGLEVEGTPQIRGSHSALLRKS